jgi:hypothetical protein
MVKYGCVWSSTVTRLGGTGVSACAQQSNHLSGSQVDVAAVQLLTAADHAQPSSDTDSSTMYLLERLTKCRLNHA